MLSIHITDKSNLSTDQTVLLNDHSLCFNFRPLHLYIIRMEVLLDKFEIDETITINVFLTNYI